MNYPFKTPSFLHVSSWSSCLNFQSYLVAVKTSSKSKELSQDSKSLPGFLEDMEVPNEPGDGVI